MVVDEGVLDEPNRNLAKLYARADPERCEHLDAFPDGEAHHDAVSGACRGREPKDDMEQTDGLEVLGSNHVHGRVLVQDARNGDVADRDFSDDVVVVEIRAVHNDLLFCSYEGQVSRKTGITGHFRQKK